jgi:Ras-related protein Rab-11A
MTRAYFRNAVGAIVVYDVTKRQTFENIKNKWLCQLHEYGHEDMYIILIGNKCDIEPGLHAVRQAEVAEFAGNLLYFIIIKQQKYINYLFIYKNLRVWTL